MKDRVERSHLTKVDAFRVKRDQVIWTLKHGSKSMQTSLMIMKVKNDPRSEFSNLSNWKEA